MKWNWGTKIALLYSTFVAFIIVMVIMAFQEDYDLVTEDYYDQEIQYQTKIDSKERTTGLDKKLIVTIENQALNISFPQQNTPIKATILCFRPSDESKDFTVSSDAFENEYSIPVNRFSKGKYLLKIDWEVDDIKYYTEQTVIIP